MKTWLATGGAALAVGLAYSTITSLPFLRASPPDVSGIRRGPGWFPSFLTGALFALAVQPLIASLHLSTPWLAVALWLLLFVLGFLLSMIEANAFSEGPKPVRTRDILGAMAASAVAATVAALLIQPQSSGSLSANFIHWVDSFGWTRWTMRLVGTAVAFMVGYCVIGSVAWRFVRRYYEDPKLGLRLRVPSGSRVILLQLGRGLLAAVALSPLLASSSARGIDGWARFACALAVTAGVIPLLGATGWPTRLRVVHGVEIVLFELAYASALVRLALP